MTPNSKPIRPDPKPITKRLKGKARQKLRKATWLRAGGYCETCGTYAPLRDSDNQFNVFECGHMSHIKSIGAGGEDTPENVKWECYRCHIGVHHGPQWSRKGVGI